MQISQQVSTQAQPLVQEWQGLLEQCEQHLLADPTSIVHWQYRSFYLSSLGRYTDAAESYQHTLSLIENDPITWCNYGSVLAMLGDFQTSLMAYDRALALAPHWVDAWKYRGTLLYRQNHYRQALVNYEQALAIAPTDRNLWYAKGMVMYQLNQPDQAIDCFKASTQSSPESADTPCREAYHALIYTLIEANRQEEALSHLDSLLSQGWEDGYLLNCYTYLLRQRGDAQAALILLQQATDSEGLDAPLWFRMGLLQAEQGHYVEAHDAFRESLKLQAYHADGWLALGIVLRKLSVYQEAIAAFDKALAIAPNHPLAFFQQACCYAALGNTAWALEHLRRAISLDGPTYLSKAQQEPILQELVSELTREGAIHSDQGGL